MKRLYYGINCEFVGDIGFYRALDVCPVLEKNVREGVLPICGCLLRERGKRKADAVCHNSGKPSCPLVVCVDLSRTV